MVSIVEVAELGDTCSVAAEAVGSDSAVDAADVSSDAVVVEILDPQCLVDQL